MRSVLSADDCAGQGKTLKSTVMGNRKWTDDYFSKRLRAEREQRGWSQADMAKRLSAKDIPMHWTTIAKIEAGDRSVRIVEAVRHGRPVRGVARCAARPVGGPAQRRAVCPPTRCTTRWCRPRGRSRRLRPRCRDRLAELAVFPGPKAFTMGFPAAAQAACSLAHGRRRRAARRALNLPAAKPFQAAVAQDADRPTTGGGTGR